MEKTNIYIFSKNKFQKNNSESTIWKISNKTFEKIKNKDLFLEILYFSQKNTFLPKSNEYVKLFDLSQASSTSSHATLHDSWKKVHDKVF